MTEDGRFIMGRDDENYAIYVAQCPTTKKYLIGVLRFLMGESAWMKAHNPTVAEVKEQIDFVASRRPIWTDEINNADIWGKYNIEQYGQYLPPVEFVKVSLSAR